VPFQQRTAIPENLEDFGIGHDQIVGVAVEVQRAK